MTTPLLAQAPPTPPPACESVVVVRCERRDAQAPRADQARSLAQRRHAAVDPFELERIVIEADPVRRSIEEAMSAAFGARPAGGTHTYSTGEGTQCSCMNRCPPLPLPCCQCSVPTRGYGASPGASPLR